MTMALFSQIALHDGYLCRVSLGEIIAPDNTPAAIPPNMALESRPIGNPEYQA